MYVQYIPTYVVVVGGYIVHTQKTKNAHHRTKKDIDNNVLYI